MKFNQPKDTTVNFRKIAVGTLTALAMLAVSMPAANAYCSLTSCGYQLPPLYYPGAPGDPFRQFNPSRPHMSNAVALHGAATLVLYYNECVKVPDDEMPLKARKFLTIAVDVFGEDAIQRTTSRMAEKIEATGSTVGDWCKLAPVNIRPEYRMD
jgi:hypothetical protein